MKAYITSLDYFGFPLTLNLKKGKGSAHKTLYGGIASAVIKATILCIFVSTLLNMFERKLDRTSKNEKLKTREDLQKSVSFKETGIQTFLFIFTIKDGVP